MSTMVSRQARREYIATALATAVTSASAVYDYLPNANTLQLSSPVVTVTSGGTDQKFASMSYNPTNMRFFVSTMVIMTTATGEANRATIEDLMDACDVEIRQWLRDNAGPTNSNGTKLWDTIVQEGPSATRYGDESGIWYRIETRLIVCRVEPE